MGGGGGGSYSFVCYNIKNTIIMLNVVPLSL